MMDLSFVGCGKLDLAIPVSFIIVDIPARWAFKNNNVVPSMLTVIPTPPLFPTLPPISPAVTADLDVPTTG